MSWYRTYSVTHPPRVLELQYKGGSIGKLLKRFEPVVATGELTDSEIDSVIKLIESPRERGGAVSLMRTLEVTARRRRVRRHLARHEKGA